MHRYPHTLPEFSNRSGMEIEYRDRRIMIPEKYTSLLDRFVIDFVHIVEEVTPYVIVSGYVAILFGRSRGTEDVDILIPHLEKGKFKSLHDLLTAGGYEFLKAEDAAGIYQMLVHGSGIRVSEKERFIPNIELKFLHDDVDSYVFGNRLEVDAAGERLSISPLEVQIAYKLFLGSEKDIEDAAYIWEIFSDRLDLALLEKWMKEFGVNGNDAGIVI